MGTPELHRSGHTPVSPDHASEVADTSRGKGGEPGAAPVPPGNQPGHHPESEQDKPRRRPRTRRGAPPEPAPEAAPAQAAPAGAERFDFAFDDQVRPIARLFGVRPGTAYVDVGDGRLTIRFGRWALSTPLANVAGTSVTGPYDWWRVAGPARLSLSDGGVTFATSTARGLCIAFHEPVPALVPTPALRHGAATVTVVDPDALARALGASDAA